MHEKYISDPTPHNQHRPICVTVKSVIVPQPTTCRKRFNIKKTDYVVIFNTIKSIRIFMKLMSHQNATISLSELYVWRPEIIHQEV